MCHAAKFLSCQATRNYSIFGWLYIPAFIVPSTVKIPHPNSLAPLMPLNISTLPPPCLTAGTMHSLWWSWPGPDQTSWTPSELSKFILVSSDHRMYCQYSWGHYSCYLAKFNLAVLEAMVFFLGAVCRVWPHVMSFTLSDQSVSTDHPWAKSQALITFLVPGGPNERLWLVSFFKYDHWYFCYWSYDFFSAY